MKIYFAIGLFCLALLGCKSSHNKTLADQPSSPTVPQVEYPLMGCEKFGAMYRPMNLETKISMGQDIYLEECKMALELSTPEWICAKTGETRFFAAILNLYSRLNTVSGVLFEKGSYGSIEDCVKGIDPSNPSTL